MKAPSPANSNAAPIIELRHTGNGAATYRALARILVRRELFFATSISDAADCTEGRAAG